MADPLLLPHRAVYATNYLSASVEAVWNLMAHGDAWEGKWRGNRRLERVATTLALCSEHGLSMVCPLIRIPRLPAVDWTDSPADLNGLVHLSDRPNLVSTRVPSRFKRAIPLNAVFRKWQAAHRRGTMCVHVHRVSSPCRPVTIFGPTPPQLPHQGKRFLYLRCNFCEK